MINYKSKLDEIPEYEVYKSNLEKFKQVDFDNTTQEKIKETILEYAVLIPQIPCILLSPSDFNKSEFYRVRKNINTHKEDLTKIKTFSYPDKGYCNENGRANLRGKSVFYCSEESATSLIETKPDDSDIYYLSIWQPKVTRDVKAATFIRKVKQFVNGDLKEIELMKPLSPQISSRGQDKTKQLEYFLNLIANYYKSEKKPYHFTSCFSDYLLYQRNFDCILYQSSEVNSFCNFAFHPDFIDNSFLEFQTVIKLETVALNNHHLSYLMREIGELKTSEIKWRQLTDEEKIYYYSILMRGEALLPYLTNA